jgi:Xaa-Pro aminopeptidase
VLEQILYILYDICLGSPVERTKAVKNPTEQKGMRDSGIRDSIARVRHLAWLENEIKNNHLVNETQAADQLEYFYSRENYFKGISFRTISAVGAHAATIHFQPNAETAVQITKDKVYLLDAGAQYLDGTTDVTRTHTFGTPTEEEKKAYTLVLQGKHQKIVF